MFISHPNYPSLYGITDVFNLLKIENVALKIPKDQFINLPDNFLTFYQGELVLVLKKNDIVILEIDNGQKQVIDFDIFIEDWEPVVLAIEPNNEISFKKVHQTYAYEWIVYTLLALGITVFSIVLSPFSLYHIAYLTTSLIGLLVAILILQEKFGIQNQFVAKFCKINNNISCDIVIKSKRSVIIKWLSFSDIPIMFFSINLVSLWLVPSSYTIVALVSGLSIPFIFYSIWLQRTQLKKWCILCLAVSFIVILQSVLLLLDKKPVFNPLVLFTYLLTSTIIIILWISIKSSLENQNLLKKENKSLKKFKKNYNIFNFLSKNIKYIDEFKALHGILLGNPNAEAKLTVFVSPGCSHCHDAIEEALELIAQFPEKISFQLLFNLNLENKDNPYTIVAKSILEINYNNPSKVFEAIHDWHIKKIDLEQWLDKWQTNTLNSNVDYQMMMQYDWCEKNEFNYTPVILINHKVVPDQYQINELKYFITHFSEPDKVMHSELIDA